MGSRARRTVEVLAAATAGLLAVVAVPAAAGADNSQKIVGGEETTIEEWPWQVAIANPPASGGDGFDRQFCGGTLLSATAVLTAAHCVYDGGFLAPRFFSVISGRTVLSSPDGAEAAVTDVIYFVDSGGVATPQSVLSAAAGPELYDDLTSEWDVAVLELAAPALPPAEAITIATAGERDLWEPGDSVFATGWGDMSALEIGDFADQLQEVEVEVIADDECDDPTVYGSGFLEETMVCAGIPTLGGKDTCAGDSGGPLVAPVGDGGFRLIGDTSFGLGCAQPGFPGVYGRVADTTMRPAITAAIPLADGVAPPTIPVSPLQADSTAPETILGKHPRKRTTKRRAVFTWTASESATFSCTLDGAPPASCASPFVKRVRAGRRHRFSVTATDAAGNVEPTAATFAWRLKRL